MKTLLRLISISCICVTLGCQSEQEQQQSYQSPVFEEIRQVTEIYAIKDQDTLGIDIFIPEDEPSNNRAVIMYVHGGGFSGGRRDDSSHLAFCRSLAGYGYVAATMSYRLIMKGKSFHCDQPANNKIAAFQSVTEDILSATDYLIRHRSEYGLDPNKVVLVGSSAGAEAVLHTVYGGQEPSIMETYLGDPNYQYAGVISMAGAIVDSESINNQTAIPTQLFHGTCDKLVPYGYAPHHYCDSSTVGFLPLHGSYSIAEKLARLDKSYFLHTTCNGGHELAGQPKTMYFDEIVDFLYQDVILGNGRKLRQEVIKEGADCDLVEVQPFCNS